MAKGLQKSSKRKQKLYKQYLKNEINKQTKNIKIANLSSKQQQQLQTLH